VNNTPEPKFSCATNNKYYLGGQPKIWKANQGTVMTKNFKKPPVLCNNLCANYNCTYTFYEKADCAETVLDTDKPDFRTTTLYPHGCEDAECQRNLPKKRRGEDPETGETLRNVEDFGFDFDEYVGKAEEGKQFCTKTDQKTGAKTPVECKYRATSNLIVRGWGTFFELDRTYKSVKFNGHGNCAFFLYEKPWFQGAVGHFRGYWNGEPNDKRLWNDEATDKAGAHNLCRNMNMTYFHQKTGSLETNDTCWTDAKRTRQDQKLVGWKKALLEEKKKQ